MVLKNISYVIYHAKNLSDCNFIKTLLINQIRNLPTSVADYYIVRNNKKNVVTIREIGKVRNDFPYSILPKNIAPEFRTLPK